MFGFFKRKIKSNKLFKFEFLNQDIHSHILPGLDDGSPDLETSIRLVKGLYNLGIRNTIATPHIIGDMFRNSPDTIMPALKLLQDEVNRQGIDITISAGAEYMLDDYFQQLLREKKKLLTIHNNIILTEFSYALEPRKVEDMAFGIFTAGYQPLLAHPERYFYFHKNTEKYTRLKDLGFLFQINLLSFTGYYGVEVQKVAKMLVDKGMADHVGTDMHHIRHLECITNNLDIIQQGMKSAKYNSFY